MNVLYSVYVYINIYLKPVYILAIYDKHILSK